MAEISKTVIDKVRYAYLDARREAKKERGQMEKVAHEMAYHQKRLDADTEVERECLAFLLANGVSQEVLDAQADALY